MEIESTTPESPRVSLGLNQDVLRTQAQFLGLDGGESFFLVEQDVIGRPFGGLILFNGCGIIGASGGVAHNWAPASRLQSFIDQNLSRCLFVHHFLY